MSEKAFFIPPVIEDNPDGWGPCAIPTAFKDIPYQPFSKGDRLGKVKNLMFEVWAVFELYSPCGHFCFQTGTMLFSPLVKC